METHRPCARRKKKLRSLPESLANGKHASTRVHRKPPQRNLKSLKTASTREKPENYARVRSVSSPDLRAHTFFFSTKSALINVGERAEKISPPGNRARASKREERDRAKTARYQSSMRTEREKERGETREHPQFTTHHFCLSKMFLLFSFFSV